MIYFNYLGYIFIGVCDYVVFWVFYMVVLVFFGFWFVYDSGFVFDLFIGKVWIFGYGLDEEYEFFNIFEY